MCALIASACFFGATLQSAYKGHADDSDIHAVLAVYPAVNGKPLDEAAVDAASGRIRGTGPLRVITPQNAPSGPDFGERAEASCASKVPPERRFHPEYDHDGGRSPFAIVAVRVKPLPPGTRDVDWASIRDQLMAKDQIVFFVAVGSGGGAYRR